MHRRRLCPTLNRRNARQRSSQAVIRGHADQLDTPHSSSEPPGRCLLLLPPYTSLAHPSKFTAPCPAAIQTSEQAVSPGARAVAGAPAAPAPPPLASGAGATEAVPLHAHRDIPCHPRWPALKREGR